MEPDNRAEDLGELIAKRMEEQNPELVGDVRQLVQDKVKTSHKPLYVKFYEGIKSVFFGNY